MVSYGRIAISKWTHHQYWHDKWRRKLLRLELSSWMWGDSGANQGFTHRGRWQEEGPKDTQCIQFSCLVLNSIIYNDALYTLCKFKTIKWENPSIHCMHIPLACAIHSPNKMHRMRSGPTSPQGTPTTPSGLGVEIVGIRKRVISQLPNQERVLLFVSLEGGDTITRWADWGSDCLGSNPHFV